MNVNNKTVFLLTIPRIILAAGAVYLAINNIAGWGWFLFVALIMGLSIENNKDD